jgi:hypothetical protein
MKYAKIAVTGRLVSIGMAWAILHSCGGNDGGSRFAGSGSAAEATTSTTSGATSGTGGSVGGGIGATSSTTTIMTTGIGSGGTSSGAGGNGVSPDAACGTTVESTRQIATDVYVLEDKSGSMDCSAAEDACTVQPRPPARPSRWDAFTNAVNGFVAAPTNAGVGVGIGFFPGAANCDPVGYAMPDVPIAALPDNAMAISNAIAANIPNGGTPTLPALTGALDYAKAYTMNTPGRTAAVLLVTDGVPNGCNSTIDAAAVVAQQAYNGTPPIKTYVVGLGNTAALDQIALAGSGGATHYFPATGDVAGQLMAILKTITGMITCNYAVPMTRPIDPNLVNVQITVGMGGMTTGVGKVSDVSACGSLGGWYYDDNTKPTQITLCPSSCDPLKMTVGSGVQILYGCPSVPPAIHF